jgi:hypothetical protein
MAACFNDQLGNNHTIPRQKTNAPSDPCIDFSAVPQISANVVATTPAPGAKQPTYSLPTVGYEGPTLGLTKPDPAHLPTPTIGYKWRLE